HVAQRASLLVERTATFNAERLRRGDLHMINVVPVPNRLEDSVAKPENQNVLHRLFAEIVIDAKHLVLVKHSIYLMIQLPSRIQIVTERLLNHNANAPLFWLRHALRAKVLDNRREVLRRSREVEQPIGPDVLLGRNPIELRLQSCI